MDNARQPYDAESAAEIIKAVGPLRNADAASLADDLCRAYALMKIRGTLNDPATARQTFKLFDPIAKHAKRILDAINISGGEDIRDAHPHDFKALCCAADAHAKAAGAYEEVPPTLVKGDDKDFLDYGAAQAVLSALTGVARLHEWARIAAGSAGTESGKNTDGHPAKPMAKFIADYLPEVYGKHAAIRFGISRPSTSKSQRIRPYGPGVTFIQLCLDVIGKPQTPEAIIQTVQRYRRSLDKARRK